MIYKKTLYLSFVLLLWGFYKIHEDPRASMYIKSVNRPDIVGEISIYIFAGVVIILMIMRRIILRKNPIPSIAFKGSFGLTFFLYFWALISSLYSFFPIYSAFRAVQYFIAILVIAFILDKQKANLYNGKAITIVNYFIMVNFIWVAIAYFIAPNLVGVETYTGQYRLLGGMPFRRDYGFIPLSIGIFSLCETLTHKNKKRRKYYFVLFAISCIYIGLYRTRGVIIVMGAVILLILYLQKKIDIKRLAIIIMLMILFFFLDHYWNLFDFILRKNTSVLFELGRRGITWEYLIAEIKNVPILGYGFLCMPFVTEEIRAYNPLVISNSHNYFLEAFFTLGYIGILLVFIIIVKIIWEFYLLWKIEKSKKTRKLITKLVAMTFVIFILFMEGVGLVGQINLSQIYLLAIMGTLQLMKHKKIRKIN